MNATSESLSLRPTSWFGAIDRRIVIVVLITLAVGFTFWLGSRVPNLNEKAMMGGDSQIEALGFDQVYAVQVDDSFAVRVLKTTVNWMDTNKRGMTFGVLFAACLMTLLSLFRRKSFKSSYGNEAVDVSHKKRDAEQCTAIADPRLREDCVALHVVWAARAGKDPSYCELIPAHRPDIAVLCRDMFEPHVAVSETAAREAIAPVTESNVLLFARPDGTFDDRAAELQLSVSGWTWNAKFADLDNDEWQDIYIANGHFPSRRRESNFFFHNAQGRKFEERTGEFGLVDRRATGAYSYVDLDGDGDLDIVSVPVNGALRVFVNEAAPGNSLIFELRDESGNRFGVGAKVIVRYGPAGSRHQMREIQAGGGFLSFDAPLAHFGLGEHDRIVDVEVRWPTGAATLLEGPFTAGSRYVITRKRGADSLAARAPTANAPGLE